MSPQYRVLVIDDQEDLAYELRDLLAEELDDLGVISVEVELNFDAAETRLQVERFDLVVLDVRDTRDGQITEDRGRSLYGSIQAARWVPVIFFTAVPAQVEHLENPPLIHVVPKGDGLPPVVACVREGLNSGVPELSRYMNDLLSREVTSFLREIVAPNHDHERIESPGERALLLVNRLAAWLKERAVAELEVLLSQGSENAISAAPAAGVYLEPPVTDHLTAGDLLRDPDGDWWLVITPSCDLYQDPAEAILKSGNVKSGKRRTPKTDFVRLARGDLLEDSAPFRAGLENSDGRNRAKQIFKGAVSRYLPLPRYRSIPDLVVDFDQVRSLRLRDVQNWERRATLDSPYCEAALQQHSHHVGRIGKPDLSAEPLLDLLKAARESLTSERGS